MTRTETFRRVVWVAAAVVAAVFLYAVGQQAAERPLIAVVAAVAILALGIIAAEPTALAVLALPIILVTARVGGGGVDLTVSDAMLAAALFPAILVAIGGISREMRTVLWLASLYQLASLFTVVQNPYVANVVEWFHAGVLVIGALLVGWAVGRRGVAPIGLTLLLLAGLLISVSTIVQAAFQYAHGEFGPVYTSFPWGMHKNAVGSLTAILAVVAYVHPPWMRWRRGWALLAFWVLVVALLTTQSRQGWLGLGAAIFVIVMRRSHGVRRRSRAILLAVIPIFLGVTVMVRDQVRSGNEFNSLFTRVTWLQDALNVWSTEPWVGVGLRWWYTDRFPVAFQPPNAEIETMTSTGIIGLAAFLVLMIGSWVVARRLDPVYGLVAEAVLVARMVQSQFDLFWVSMAVSLPFAILGICLGAAARHDATVAEESRAARLTEGAAPHSSDDSVSTAGPDPGAAQSAPRVRSLRVLPPPYPSPHPSHYPAPSRAGGPTA
ncbi:hypothetical protein N865_03040 [Intrasporangium oryzae NRRL B-24470]|uniref:O-antigen ligase-related domain-containing protein n=1 Tax=Intrasporangium oryzae NRRL B-24470 TaxID=1386089 RepID=W9GD72_9MICO|nr:O-antigen ligase family protein [Intrasporangium oryzae]EWT02783.1 hypothetical protein N865_03040 [Intrasporangium oryzae NRRL B-24470]